MLNIGWLGLLFGDTETELTSTLQIEDAQIFFDIGDRVQFYTRDGGTMTGTIEKLNPKRAGVRCGTDSWVVPYAGLDHLCAATVDERRPRADRLKEVAFQARNLMDRHGLEEWALHFSSARRKLGECRSRQKLILLSRAHAVSGAPEQVTDTVLHEIAHALAGPGAGHGPAWKEIARQIGAVPKAGIYELEGDDGDVAKEKFRTGDAVTFIARGKCWTGIIVRMNPKRAKVKCDNCIWAVPYAKLENVLSPGCSPEN